MAQTVLGGAVGGSTAAHQSWLVTCSGWTMTRAGRARALPLATGQRRLPSPEHLLRQEGRGCGCVEQSRKAGRTYRARSTRAEPEAELCSDPLMIVVLPLVRHAASTAAGRQLRPRAWPTTPSSLSAVVHRADRYVQLSLAPFTQQQSATDAVAFPVRASSRCGVLTFAPPDLLPIISALLLARVSMDRTLSVLLLLLVKSDCTAVPLSRAQKRGRTAVTNPQLSCMATVSDDSRDATVRCSPPLPCLSAWR